MAVSAIKHPTHAYRARTAVATLQAHATRPPRLASLFPSWIERCEASFFEGSGKIKKCRKWRFEKTPRTIKPCIKPKQYTECIVHQPLHLCRTI